MILKSGQSKAVISANVKELLKSGKSKRQAAVIAMSKAKPKKSKKSKKSHVADALKQGY